MKVRITVTDDYITAGQRESPIFCPLALAVKSLVKSQYARTVRVRSVSLQFTRIIRRSLLSHSAQRFIWRFDHSKPVQPASFVVDIPKRYLKTA